MLPPFPILLAVATLPMTLPGCATDGEREALAEEYAQRESRQIDEASFRHARDRSRLLRSTEAVVQASAPLPIQRAVTDRWQFGVLDHPIDDRPACAALSGTADIEGEDAALRLVVLEDHLLLEGDRALNGELTDLTVRVDAGLPIPFLIHAEDDRIAVGQIEPGDWYPMLGNGTVASIAMSVGDGLADGPTGTERLLLLEGLGPMLEELVRCDSSAVESPVPG